MPLKKIKQYNIIVIARHISPDPDAIASQVSLRDAIKLTFPKKEVYAVGTSVSKFKYYGNLDRVDDSIFYLDIVEKIPSWYVISGRSTLNDIKEEARKLKYQIQKS